MCRKMSERNMTKIQTTYNLVARCPNWEMIIPPSMDQEQEFRCNHLARFPLPLRSKTCTFYSAMSVITKQQEETILGGGF